VWQISFADEGCRLPPVYFPYNFQLPAAITWSCRVFAVSSDLFFFLPYHIVSPSRSKLRVSYFLRRINPGNGPGAIWTSAATWPHICEYNVRGCIWYPFSAIWSCVW
jgi:hypothetical protein